MREIKFRAWDGERMKPILTWGFNEKFISTPKIVSDESDFKIMQYTGLKDKNGVEIYEGDILKQFGDILTVFWKEGGFSVKKQDGVNKGLTLVPSYLISAEVIGNIHENPELLK